MQAGITSGIVLAVLIPCACFLLCFLQWCKGRGGDYDDDIQPRQ